MSGLSDPSDLSDQSDRSDWSDQSDPPKTSLDYSTVSGDIANMASILVDIAGMKTASGGANELATHTLGSCVAVAVYDPVGKVGGLLHYMLPEASLNPDKARQNPYMFGDTGIPLLFRAVYQLGAERERIIVKMAGGANVMDQSGTLNMGKRNCQAARRIFHKNGLLVAAELVGGVSGKTMRLRLKDGSVEVLLPGGEVRIL